MAKNDWRCVNPECGRVLGSVIGGEFHPDVHGKYLRTSGPNLTVICPDCGSVKVFYTSDPMYRAMYQLLHAISDEAAKSMIDAMGKEVRNLTRA